MSFYGDGSFDFVGTMERDYFKNAHWALTETNLWTWFANFTPPNNEGFTFCNDDTLKILENKMLEQDVAHNHSGFSFEYTMKNMKYIAEHGYNAFQTAWQNNTTGH